MNTKTDGSKPTKSVSPDAKQEYYELRIYKIYDYDKQLAELSPPTKSIKLRERSTLLAS